MPFSGTIGRMKLSKILLIFFGGLVVLPLGGCDFFNSKKIKPESSLTTFNLVSVEGFLDPKPEESKLLSRAIVVNFWASWCAPCQQETPELLKIAKIYKDQLNLLMISGDGSSKEMKKFMSLFPNFKAANIFVAQDISRDWIQKYGVSGFPETFVYDQKHQLIARFEGALDFESIAFKKALEKITTMKID